MQGTQTIGSELAETMSHGAAPLFTAMGAGVLIMIFAALIVAFLMRASQQLPEGV